LASGFVAWLGMFIQFQFSSMQRDKENQHWVQQQIFLEKLKLTNTRTEFISRISPQIVKLRDRFDDLQRTTFQDLGNVAISPEILESKPEPFGNALKAKLEFDSAYHDLVASIVVTQTLFGPECALKARGLMQFIDGKMSQAELNASSLGEVAADSAKPLQIKFYEMRQQFNALNLEKIYFEYNQLFSSFIGSLNTVTQRESARDTTK